jgi:hypothetical protein
LYLVNQGTDEAVRGLQRLKRTSGFAEAMYGGTLARLEHARAQVNLQFFDDMRQSEQRDAARYEHPPRDAGEQHS